MYKKTRENVSAINRFVLSFCLCLGKGEYVNFSRGENATFYGRIVGAYMIE